MGETSIEWTDSTWNPVRGCKMISPGCTHCYAMKQAGRFSGPGKAYHGLVTLGAKGKGFRWTGDFREVPEMLDVPLRTRKPTMWFVNSMSDLFGEGVSNEYVAAVFGVMAATPRHTYQVLTKRAERLPKWSEWYAQQALVAGELWIPMMRAACELLPERSADQLHEDAIARLVPRDEPWPLPNVWLGVSVENRKHGLPRIDELRKVPAVVRFLSVEPLLEDLGEIDLTGIHWVIVGGESGNGARPFDLAWARSILRQCQASRVPCFVKQLGAKPRETVTGPERVWTLRSLEDRKGGDPSEWPADLRVREMPARA